MDEKIGWKIATDSNYAYSVDQSYLLSKQEAELYAQLADKYGELCLNGKIGRPISETLHNLLKNMCMSRNILLPLPRGLIIEKVAKMNIEGLGVFELFLSDDKIEEICANGINRPIRVFMRSGAWRDTNCQITSKDFALDAINKMARSLGRRITYKTPMLNAQLPDGSRLHASISPLNADGFEITIRKFTKNPISIAQLIANKTLSAEASAFLWLTCLADASILVCGNTGSGKTTFLNALFSFIPLSERVIIAEETPEINIPHKHRINLVANSQLGISMQDLVHNTLRMRPDRVIVGEVRTKEETLSLLESLQAGQAKGCYATFHAQNAKEAISRLRGFGISTDDLSAIDLVVILRRFSQYGKDGAKELRRVFEIAEITDGKPHKLFEYDAKSDGLLANMKNIRESALLGKLEISYIRDCEMLLLEMNKRREKISEFIRNGLTDYENFTLAAQKTSF